MKDMITDEQMVFKFKNRWFSFHEDDGDVWRESPAIRPGVKPLPGKNKPLFNCCTLWRGL